MNSLTTNKSPKTPNPDCADLMRMAEQELAAFFDAATELFGSEQAQHSAEDWLHELEAIEDLPVSTRGWRSITARVARRLATRVNASSRSIESQILRRKGLCVFSSQAPQAS
jgi:hypothetical protein